MAQLFLIFLSLTVIWTQTDGYCSLSQAQMTCFGSTESQFVYFVGNLDTNISVLSFFGTRIPTFTKKMFGHDRLKSITILNIVNAGLKRLDDDIFEGYNNLATINIEINNDLKNVTVGTFRGAQSLINLNLDGAGIEKIDPGSLMSLPRLTKLKINYNKIPYLAPGTFYGSTPSGVVSLEDNEIVHIIPGTFFGMTRVDTLRLGRNKLTYLEDSTFQGLSAVRYLHLDNNTLSSLNYAAFRGLINLNTLDLSYTGIKYYSMNELQRYMPNLRYVTIK